MVDTNATKTRTLGGGHRTLTPSVLEVRFAKTVEADVECNKAANRPTAGLSPFKTRSVCRILNSELKLPPENMVLISPTIDRHKGSQEQSALRFGGYWVPIRL